MHGEDIMKKENAVQVKERAHKAIAELDRIVAEIRGNCPEEEFKSIRRSVGNSMAVIINEILEPIYKQYPEIDDQQN
jgi:hypothetical protein